mgnify:CR=1 FL=1
MAAISKGRSHGVRSCAARAMETVRRAVTGGWARDHRFMATADGMSLAAYEGPARAAAASVRALLAREDLWGKALPGNVAWTARVTHWHQQVLQHGVDAAIQQLLQQEA